MISDKHAHLSEDALRQFNGLFNITKVLFKYSYADSNDKAFMQEEKLIEMMAQVVSRTFANSDEHSRLLNFT